MVCRLYAKYLGCGFESCFPAGDVANNLRDSNVDLGGWLDGQQTQFKIYRMWSLAQFVNGDAGKEVTQLHRS